MKKLIPVVLTGILLYVFACNTVKTSAKDIQRAHDPWVFRSVLDGKARMLTLALNDNLWAAYSAEDGTFYKAWRGSVNFDGAVYTTVHGPQPSSLGNIYFQNEYNTPWEVELNGQKTTPKLQYRGHRFKDEQVIINYELQLDNGQRINIGEKPEYVESESGLPGLQRTFTVKNLPKGAKLYFLNNLSSIAVTSSIKTDGNYDILNRKERKAGSISGIDVEGRLTLNGNGSTTLTTFFTETPLIENENKIVDGGGDDLKPLGFRLIERNDCKTCHNTYVKTIGPAYVDVAKRYRNNPSNVEYLVKKVINGGSGVWGEAAMNAHHEVAEADIRSMVSYIMELDSDEEALMPAEEAALGALDFVEGDSTITGNELLPGVLVKIYNTPGIESVDDINTNQKPLYEGILQDVHVETSEFATLEANFAMVYEGVITIPKDNNYVFRLLSDDGSKMYLDGQEIIDHDGFHGASPKDGEVALKAGNHPFKVKFFQGYGGKFLSLQWKSFDDEQFSIVPATAFSHLRANVPSPGAESLPMSSAVRIPGDQFPLEEVHPSYDLSQARPDGFLPKVGGMDFFSDGRMVVSTWDAEGAVYVLDNVDSGDPSKIEVKKIAKGLAEPLGLKVVEDTIYILQKQELTKLIDHDGDDVIDEYYTVSNDWRVSANFHEFAFGLAYKDGYFYGALAIAILPGGASANPQIPDRGKAVRINRQTGELDFMASGLRTPNGVGFGKDGELFIADNQGDWLPSSKILHVEEGDFFGSRAVDSARVAQLPVKQPVVWLPQDEIGNSPTTPSYLNDGPYKGQMIHGEVTHGGVKRVFVEEVNGNYQGAVFRFIQGLEAGVNRLVWGPDGALYIGGIGSTGNWRQNDKLWYGIQRLKYNGKSAFEMLAVRAKSNGVEIEFTEPLEANQGLLASEYTVQQWWYLPTSAYGGPKRDLENLAIKSVNMSDDRKKVFLELDGMKEGHVVYLRLPSSWISDKGQELWTTEAWYTMNAIPANEPGFVNPAPAPLAHNTLSAEEKADGWKLLFDGQSTDAWRNYRKETIGSSWKAIDGALVLDSKQKDDGGWQAADGGDIITKDKYENYELRLEWKIATCGNSGVIFNVMESEDYDYVWQTGPELQILDNTCHPDARIPTHRAGDLYDMIECEYLNVRPAGEWNKVRLIVHNGKVEQWLNGRKLVEYEMWTKEWKQMIANSKFKDMAAFGTIRKGHIALQDHGDRVAFRNIKIKELNTTKQQDEI